MDRGKKPLVFRTTYIVCKRCGTKCFGRSKEALNDLCDGCIEKDDEKQAAKKAKL